MILLPVAFLLGLIGFYIAVEVWLSVSWGRSVRRWREDR